MTERVAKWASWIARAVINELLESRQFHRLLRHIVLSVVVEQEHQRTREILDTFFECCHESGIEVSVKAGKLIFTNPQRLNEYLQQVVVLYRKRIIEHLEMMDQMASREKLHLNGKHR